MVAKVAPRRQDRVSPKLGTSKCPRSVHKSTHNGRAPCAHLLMGAGGHPTSGWSRKSSMLGLRMAAGRPEPRFLGELRVFPNLRLEPQIIDPWPQKAWINRKIRPERWGALCPTCVHGFLQPRARADNHRSDNSHWLPTIPTQTDFQGLGSHFGPTLAVKLMRTDEKRLPNGPSLRPGPFWSPCFSRPN
jgi:hypothetical protein